MIEKSIEKLDLNFDVLESAKEMGLEILAFDGMDAAQLGTLPLHYKDLFVIISQALSKAITSSAITKNSNCIIVNCSKARSQKLRETRSA